MTYRGHVKNGQITLDEPAPLPEGAAVDVQVVVEANGNRPSRDDRRAILRMPMEQRRQLLTQQSQRLAPSYESESDRTDWQGGDIVE